MAEEKRQERDRAATVIQQLGDRVEVNHKGERLTVEMRGFPTGFTLSPGARVILVDEASGVVARPLVRAVTSRGLERAAVERRGSLDVEGRRVEMQQSTVIEEDREKRPGEEYVVWIVERARPEGAEAAPAADQAIAVRRE